MSTWSPLPTASCVHKHAIGCLLLNQSICCFCADCNSFAPAYPPALFEGNRVPYNANRYSKYCWKCQEYWGTRQGAQILPASIQANRILQSSLSALNLPANSSEIYSQTPYLNSGSQGVIAQFPGISPGSGGSQRSIYHRCNNITALREELQVINTGIARALSSLRHLGGQLSSYQSSQISQGVMPPMENNMQAASHSPTFHNSGISTTVDGTGPQTSTDYNVFSQGPLNQSHQVTQQSLYGVPNSDVSTNTQDQLNGSAFSAPAADSHFTWSDMNSQAPGTAPQQSATSPAMNPMTEPGNGENSVPSLSEQDWRRAFENSWGEYTRLEFQRRSLAFPQGASQVMGTTSLYANGRPRQPYQHSMGGLQPVGAHFVPQQGYPFGPQASLNFSSAAEAQHVSGVRVTPYPLAQPHSNPHMSLPHSDASNLVAQQRRREAQSLAGDATTAVGPNPSQTTTQNTRRRSRRTDDPGLHYSRRPSPPRYEGGAVQTATAQFAEIPVPAGGNYISYATLSPQQQAFLAQRMQLGNVLRNMRPEEAEALRIYEQSLARSRRLHQEQAAADQSLPSKGLDNQNDGRPEPKEAEELTVNLECRVCLSQLVDTVVLPCGHAILCRWCADQHMPSSRADQTRPKKPAACPMCRKPVKQKLRIYLS